MTTIYTLRKPTTDGTPGEIVLVGANLLMVAQAQAFHAEEFGKEYVLHIEDTPERPVSLHDGQPDVMDNGPADYAHDLAVANAFELDGGF